MSGFEYRWYHDRTLVRSVIAVYGLVVLALIALLIRETAPRIFADNDAPTKTRFASVPTPQTQKPRNANRHKTTLEWKRQRERAERYRLKMLAEFRRQQSLKNKPKPQWVPPNRRTRATVSNRRTGSVRQYPIGRTTVHYLKIQRKPRSKQRESQRRFIRRTYRPPPGWKFDDGNCTKNIKKIAGVNRWICEM